MAINFTDSPANGATQVVGGRTYTYNSAKNKWDTTATEVTGPTATVYATVDALPTSGNITGAQAYVSGNNRLYIWNGTGWYNIALINTAPTISGVNAAYELATDGSSTSVVITATDPEGLPLTYSIVSDTSGDIATVTQGVGGNTDIFTITPTTNTANGGTFSLTFRASDGVNIATAVAEFTLQFRVPNSPYTTALITTNGSTGTNSTFTDSSSNSHTVTAYGNTTQTSFSPYRSGGYSTYFDGSGDYISMPYDSSFDLIADFTIEFWFNPSDSTIGGITQNGATSFVGNAFTIVWDHGTYADKISVWERNNSNSGTTALLVSSTLSTNEWHHVAVTRSGSTATLWINGVSAATATDSNTWYIGETNLIIGKYWGADFTGYIRDFRVVKGTAVYTAAFTPPTESLTAITNTSLLACHLPYIADGSTNNHTLTPNGNVSTKPFAPYDYKEYTVGDHGGSAYFDGSGDYVEMAGHSSLALDTSDFTVEFWYKHVANVAAGRFFGNNYQESTWGSGRWTMGIDNGKLFFNANSLHGGSGSTLSTVSINDGSWHHCSLTRSGSTFTLRVDGKDPVTYTNSGSIDGNNLYGFTVGARGNGAEATNGYISDFRLVKGTAVYTADFTPPTAPLTAITNTSLLLNMQGAKILDKSQSTQNLTLVGNTTASTAQYKYLPTSIYFDGTGDYIATSLNNNFSSKSYTIEGWFYPSINLTGRYSLFNVGSGTSATDRITIGVYDGTFFHQHEVGNSNTITVLSGGIGNYTLTSGQWHHFEMVFDWGGAYDSTSTGYIFMNGVVQETYRLSAHVATSIVELSRSDIAGGAKYFPGYISDFRVRQGIAAHTANFTPPSAALKG